MKKCLAYLVALALAAFPAAARAQAVDLIYDDGLFEASTPISLPGGPLALPAPAVQFDAPAPGTGVYALDSVSFYLLQVPVVVPAAGGAPNGAPPAVLLAATPATYPITVQIWSQGAGTEWIPGAPLDADFVVDEAGGWHILDLTGEKLTFTGSVRIGIFLRDDSLVPAPLVPVPLVPIPTVPVALGVDTISTMPFGHSFGYDSAIVPPWTPVAVEANYGIRASVHLVPALTCQGFLPPLDRDITMKKGGRTLPLKAFLLDDAGAAVTRRLLTAPPLVQLLYTQSEGVVPVDVTDFVAPAGRSNKGQAFRGTRGGMWIYNLKTKKSLPPGTYTVLMGSGDGTEYVVDPTCTGTFVIDAPKPKKPHPTKGPK